MRLSKKVVIFMLKNRFVAILLLGIVLITMFLPSAYAANGNGGGDGIKPLFTNGKSFNYKNGNDFQIPGVTVNGGGKKAAQSNQWSTFLGNYKSQIAGISGAVSLTFLILFIISFSKLGSSAGNPHERQNAMMGIIWCGIACALTGGIGIFFGFFYNMFTKA